MFAIACGYEDCDDLDALRFDPAFKLACGRLAETGDELMSQPTLSRLENAPSWRVLARMGLFLIDLFCASFKAVPARIVLDIDDTEDAVHGGQQLALFNAHYDGYCFQPIHIFEAATGKPVLSLLRPGKRPSGEEAARILEHVIGRIRHNWPRVGIIVRGDGHYGTPQVMELLEDQGLRLHLRPIRQTPRLSKIGQPWCEDVAVRRVHQEKDKLRRFFQTGYQAKSWPRERRVIARVEATSKGADVRFVVTNLSGHGPRCFTRSSTAPAAGWKNMIKEHKLYTRSDRTSCHRWEANQFRPLSPHRCLLAVAPASPVRAPPLALAQGDVRNAPPGVPQKLPCASRNSSRASGSPCRRPIHIRKPSSRWQAASPPKAPDTGGMRRRKSPERQPLTPV